MASNIVKEQIQQESSCCKELKDKYLKLRGEFLKAKERARKLKDQVDEAVAYAKILAERVEKVDSENRNLQKACSEERVRADAEKVDKDKEADIRITLEKEISVWKSENSLLRQKGGSGAPVGDVNKVVLEKNISNGQIEIKRLEQLLVMEKLKSASEREKAEAEKRKYTESLMVLEEKSRVDETKRLAEIELKKAEESRLQLESENKNLKLKALKDKLDKDKRYKDFEKAKSEELRKLVGEYDKKILEEKSYADNLSRQLIESKQKNEELTNKVQEFVAFKNKEASDVRSDTMKRESIEAKLVKESLKVNEVNKKFEAEKRKASKEKKCADDLSRRIEEDRRKIEELRRENDELISCRNLIEASCKQSNKCENIGEMKLLKKQLKFEKERVTHAKELLQLEKDRNKELLQLEKDRNNCLQQEVSRFKQDFVQFSQRLDFFDKSLSCGSEGIDQVTETKKLSKLQKSKLKRKKTAVEPIQMFLQGETGLGMPSAGVMDANNRSGKNLELTVAPLVPGSKRNITDLSSGIGYRLGSPHGGSDRKILPSSAISSSIASFSDGQLAGSQENHAFSVATSAKQLAEDNLKLRKCISRLSDKSNMRNNENFLLSDVVESVAGEGKKRKRIVNVVESIANSFSEGKKLHVQIEEKMSILPTMLNKQLYDPFEEARGPIPTPVGDSYASFGGSCKKRKISHKKGIVKIKDIGDLKLVEQVNSPVSNTAGSIGAQRDCVVTTVPIIDDQGPCVSFEKVLVMDFMKLLDLDNPADEARYRMAREEPVSPTLPIIEFPSGKVIAANNSKISSEKTLYVGSSPENDNVVPGCSIGVEIASNNLEIVGSETFHDLLLPNSRGLFDPYNGKRKEHRDNCYGICTGKSLHDNIPELCVVFSDTKDKESISRLYSSTRNCIAQCNLFSQSSWAVEKILHDTAIEDLVPREKACVFFSVMLYNFTSVVSKGSGNFSDSLPKPCLDSFSRHMHSVISNTETRSILLKLCCLEELFSLIEDFLMEARILSRGCPFSEGSNNPRISDTDLMYKKASHDQLLAGSIILASLCVAVDDIGFLCDVSYNLFSTSRIDSALRLAILHTFSNLGGEKYFTLSSHGLLMVVVKSLVTHLERMGVSAGTDFVMFVNEDLQEVSPCSIWPQFPPCSKCPFSQYAVTLDDLILLLLEKLQNYYALSEKKKCLDMEKSINSLHSVPISFEEQSKESSGHEGDCGVLDTNCDKSCCLDRLVMLGTQPDSNRFLCPCIDILSLVELVSSKMSWAWSCNKVVPRLLKMLGSCELDNLAAAIFILLGQLGRIGVGSSGYKDAGVESMRNRLTDFLPPDNTGTKSSFPVQIAIVTALLVLLPINFEVIIADCVQPNNVTTKWTSEDVIRKWFSFLSKEQQLLASTLLQSLDVNKTGIMLA